MKTGRSWNLTELKKRKKKEEDSKLVRINFLRVDVKEMWPGITQCLISCSCN